MVIVAGHFSASCFFVIETVLIHDLTYFLSAGTYFWPNARQQDEAQTVFSTYPKPLVKLNFFWCCKNALANMREAYCEEKKQSKSSTTNMPLNLLMITTSPYSGSLQLAIKFFTGVNSWCCCLVVVQVRLCAYAYTDLLHLLFALVPDSHWRHL